MPSWNELVLEDLQFDIFFQKIEDMEPLHHMSPPWPPASLADTVDYLLLLSENVDTNIAVVGRDDEQQPRKVP